MSVVSGYRVAGVPSTTEDKAAKQTVAKRTMESLQFIVARFLIKVNGTDGKRGLSRRRQLQLKLGLSISIYLIFTYVDLG